MEKIKETVERLGGVSLLPVAVAIVAFILIGAPSRSVDVPGQPGLPNSRIDFQIIVD